MNDDLGKDILEELRKQNMQSRRANRAATITLGVFLFVYMFIFIPFHDRILAPFMPRPQVTQPPQVADTWGEARNLRDNEKFDKAKEMIERLIAKHPDFYYGYALLGSLHHELGDLTTAESNYAKAYDLFPDEYNDKTLTALRKALQNKKGTPNTTSEPSIAPASQVQR